MPEPLHVPVPSEEAERLSQLETATFVETFGPENDPEHLAAHVARAFAVERLAAQLEDPSVELSWVLDGDAPVAFLKLNLGDAQTEPGLSEGLEVEQVYVLGSHQGRGLGRSLLEHAVARAHDHGLAFVWLGVWEHNRKGIAVYERFGFEAFGEHSFLVGGDEQRDVLMRLDLT